MAKTVYDTKSNYALTGINRKYLGIYQPPLTNDSLSEETITLIVQPKFNKRPDLMAFEMYGSAKLWCVYPHYKRDKQVEPIMEYISGTKTNAG